MKPTKLYEALFILYKCNLTINRLWSLIETSQEDIDEIKDHALLFTNYIKMESVSFLEEFNEGFYFKIENDYKQRMNEVRLITAPIIKRIKKWKDLEKFRNNIIAHPWRNKGKFVVPDQHLYNVPRNWFEIGVLVNLVNYVWSVIKVEFQNELNEAFQYVESLTPPQKAMSDYSTINTDHRKMAEEVDKVCKQLNKNYYLKVVQYILPE